VTGLGIQPCKTQLAVQICARKISEKGQNFAPDNSPLPHKISSMSKAEIIAELPKLTEEERYEIRVRLAELDSNGWLDSDDPLTDEDKQLIDRRLAEHEANPRSAISFAEYKSRLQEHLGR
jgi:hypothetical protein